MIRQIVLTAFLAGACSVASAQTASVALPDTIAYPEAHCTKPQVNMVKPGAWNNSEAVDSYNLKVKKFNQEAMAYGSCMHAYIDKANSDVKTIQDKANADLKQVSERANGSMKAIQDKIRQAVADAKGVAAAIDEQTAKLRNR
jgi:hypothetical protein